MFKNIICLCLYFRNVAPVFLLITLTNLVQDAYLQKVSMSAKVSFENQILKSNIITRRVASLIRTTIVFVIYKQNLLFHSTQPPPSNPFLWFYLMAAIPTKPLDWPMQLLNAAQASTLATQMFHHLPFLRYY